VTSPGMPLAVVRLYQHKAGAGLNQLVNRKTQVRPCGDEENRTLNPRLANSIHPVRHGPGNALTWVDSPAATAEVRSCRPARQHNWQQLVDHQSTPARCCFGRRVRRAGAGS